MWFWFALASAVFAALTSILAKVGIEGVNSNLATAIRTVVVVAMAWGMVFITNSQGGIATISVPVRLKQNHIGKAIIIAARTRPKFIGGERAHYNDSLKDGYPEF